MRLESYGKYRAICHTKSGLLLYTKQKLFLMNYDTKLITEVCNFKVEDNRKIFCHTTFGARFCHITAYCGIEVDGGAVVAFNRGVYFVDLEEKEVKREMTFSVDDMRRPLAFTEISGIEGFQDCVVFGEYSNNQSRNAIAIYARYHSKGWQQVYEFPEGEIRHVHSIIPDPYRNRILILTGDNDEECGIWEATNDFQNVRPIFRGSQYYRVCCAKAYPEGVVIVTDSPFDQNYIYLLKENQDKVVIERMQELPGPTTFFAEWGENLVFGTDVEYDSLHLKGRRAYLTYKLGAGVKDWYVHLYCGNQREGFSEFARMKKDILPIRIFGYGNVHFPAGSRENELYFTPLAVKRYDEKLVMVKRDDICSK